MRRFLKSRRGKIIVSIAGLILLVFLQQAHVLRPIESGISIIVSPLQKVLISSAVKIKGLKTYFRESADLRDENAQLRDDMIRLTAENQKLRTNIKNSEQYNREVEFLKEKGFISVQAYVTSRSSDNYLQIININRGTSDGIDIRYPVITDDGILVGHVLSTSNQTSKVILLNDINSKVSAIIQNDERSPGTVSGEFGIALKLELIPENHHIQTGQLVVTSGLQEFTPADLIIGQIGEISRLEGELFQESTVLPYTTYQNLTIVSIIIPSDV